MDKLGVIKVIKGHSDFDVDGWKLCSFLDENDDGVFTNYEVALWVDGSIESASKNSQCQIFQLQQGNQLEYFSNEIQAEEYFDRMAGNKSVQLMHWLQRMDDKGIGVRYIDMQRFYWVLNGKPGTTFRTFKDGVFTRHESPKMSRGYFCDAIALLIEGNMIVKKDKRYFISIVGKLNMNKPMTKKPKLNTAAKLFLAEKRLEEMRVPYNYYVGKCCDLDNENRSLKRTIIELRESVNTISRGIHEDSLYG